jgi:hypothetical protein
MRLPQPKQQSANTPGSPHVALQTSATVIGALATVFALVLAQAKDNPKIVWTLVVVAALSFLAIIEPFVRRLMAFIQTRRVRRIRDEAARAEHAELMTFVRRLEPFTDSDHPNNIWHIIHSSYANDFEKAERVCPTDYMKDLFPLFARQLETHPPENEKQFLRATEDLCLLIASYNRNYVSESFRRMREKRWELSPIVDSSRGTSQPANPSHGTWLASLPTHYQESVERRIEEFREVWVVFLDDMKKWLEHVNETFGVSLSTYFERPQKL